MNAVNEKRAANIRNVTTSHDIVTKPHDNVTTSHDNVSVDVDVNEGGSAAGFTLGGARRRSLCAKLRSVRRSSTALPAG